MSPIEVRPFRRSDRDQLTHLVNAHAAAVVPGMSASVSAVLSALERQPGEFIEDPWVSERVTLVAQQQGRVAAGAHLLRHFADERAGIAARDSGSVEWLLFWPEAPDGNPCWPDATSAADALMTECIGQLEQWGVTRQEAGGELPVRGVYGIPEQWPHIGALYERAGFLHTGHTEIIYMARVARGSGCHGTAGGPMSATCTSPSRTGAEVSVPGSSGRQRTGYAQGMSTGSWTTPGLRVPTRAARTTRTTGPSCWRPGSRYSPGRGEDGPGRRLRDDSLKRSPTRPAKAEPRCSASPWSGALRVVGDALPVHDDAGLAADGPGIVPGRAHHEVARAELCLITIVHDDLHPA